MDRVQLKSNQQTTVAVGFARDGKTQTEPGDAITVGSSAGTILSARYNPDTGLVDVVPIEGAAGIADVFVMVTLADGTLLPPQNVPYLIVHPDIDAVVLTPGGIVDKTTIITNPLPNPDPHVVAAPVSDVPPPETLA